MGYYPPFWEFIWPFCGTVSLIDIIGRDGILTTREIWVNIPGYSNYQVSNLGRIWSRPRRNTKGGILRCKLDKQGYVQIDLFNESGRRTRKVHRLVAQAFLGECPAGMEVCHNDGNNQNNAVENLRYDTHQNNALQMYREHGVVAWRAKQTHCDRGHEFSDENTGRQSHGRRYCRICDRAGQRRRYQGV